MKVKELISRLEDILKTDGKDAEVVLIEDGGDRYGTGVSLVSGKFIDPNNGLKIKVVTDKDRLMHIYIGGDIPLW